STAPFIVAQSDWLPMTTATLGCTGEGLISTLRQVVPLKRGEGVVQLVDDRLAGGDLEACDVGIRNAGKVLDQRPQRIAVGGDEHGLARLQRRGDRRLVIG